MDSRICLGVLLLLVITVFLQSAKFSTRNKDSNLDAENLQSALKELRELKAIMSSANKFEPGMNLGIFLML